MASQDSATSSAGADPTPSQDGTTTDAPPNVFQLQNRRFFLFQEAARWLPDEVFQRLAQVEVAHLTEANKHLEEFIQNHKVPRDPMQGKTATRLPSSSRCKSRRGPNRQEVECLEQAGEETARMVHDRLSLKGLRPRTQRAMRREVTWHTWTKICGWVPFLAPLRSQVACLIAPRQESHKTPCRSCPPNRAGQSRQSAHPPSSVGFASKCMGHPWEGTVHQHIAIRTDHRRRTARTARDCTATTGLGVPGRRGKIPVRPACVVNHYHSCDPQHAMPSAEAAQAMSTESQLSLGPDAGPNDDSTQVGEAARAIEPRSRYRPDGSRRRNQGELQKRRKAKQKNTGFWATPQGRRIAAPKKRSKSGTAPKLGRIGTECGTIGGLQSKPQDWRHDWQWEDDRDRTPKGSSASNAARRPRR